MTSSSEVRLWLIGDDEALDILADLSRHLAYFQVARGDEVPATLNADDHVVVATHALAKLATGAGLTVVLSTVDDDSAGARAITAGSELVAALRARRRQQS